MWIVNFMDYLVKVLTYFWLFGHNCVRLLRYHHFCYTNNFRIFPYPVISCASYSKFVKLLEAWNTIVRCNEFFIFILYRFLNIWPKCEVAAAAATRPFKTELVGHWGESNLAAAHQTAAVFEPQRRKKTILWPPRELVLVLLSLGRLSLEPQKKGGENLTPPLSSLLSHSFFKKQHQNRNCPQNLW